MINTNLHNKALRKMRTLWCYCYCTDCYGMSRCSAHLRRFAEEAVGTIVGSKTTAQKLLTACSYTNRLLHTEIDPSTWIERRQSVCSHSHSVWKFYGRTETILVTDNFSCVCQEQEQHRLLTQGLVRSDI